MFLDISKAGSRIGSFFSGSRGDSSGNVLDFDQKEYGDVSVISKELENPVSLKGSFSRKEFDDVSSRLDSIRDSVVFLEEFESHSLENYRIISDVKKELSSLDMDYGSRTNLFRESSRLLDDFKNDGTPLIIMFSAMESQYDSFSRHVKELGFSDDLSHGNSHVKAVSRDNNNDRPPELLDVPVKENRNSKNLDFV